MEDTQKDSLDQTLEDLPEHLLEFVLSWHNKVIDSYHRGRQPPAEGRVWAAGDTGPKTLQAKAPLAH